MPISTELLRNGYPVPLRWGMWHVARIADAREAEEGHKEFGYWENYTFTKNHEFTDESDGEFFPIFRGDKFVAYR